MEKKTVRLLDADETRNGIVKHFIDYIDDATPEQVGFNEGLGAAIDELDSQTAVEVVRCRDCKWYNLLNKTAGFCYHPKHDDHAQGTDACGDDGFCSDGERRADGGNV